MSIEKLSGEILDSKQINVGENLQTRLEIGETLDDKQHIFQIIEKIENKGVKSVFISHFTKGKYPLTRIEEELKAYNNFIYNLSNENVQELNDIILKYNLLPSVGIREFDVKNDILSEKNLEVVKLIETSLKSGVKPSVIKEGKDTYKKLAMVNDHEKKNLILYYLKEAYTPKLVFEKYEIFRNILNYKYKDKNLKNFVLSLIKDEKVDPSLIELYFDLFNDKEFGEETENYIRGLLNQPKK